MKPHLHRLLSTTYLSAAMLCAVSAPGYANPVDGTVTGGGASIDTAGNVLTITQHTNRAVIDWRGFDIGAGETTQFIQPNSGSIAVNRVTQGGASHIDGNLRANGNVVILNQNGVMFGAGSRVDVNGLVASTADINTGQFMSGGHLVLGTPGNPGARIVNEGQITAKDAGLVGFVAPNVINDGIITVRLGRAHLASGDTAVVDFYGDGLMNVALSDAVTSQLVSNSGTIIAEGGKIALTAAAGSNIVNGLITNSGTLQAQTVANARGEIIIDAQSTNGAGGVIDHTGLIDASGSKGGTVTLRGRNIAQQGTIKANGTTGSGGYVSITATDAYIDSAQAVTTVAGTVNGSMGGTDANGVAADGGSIAVTAGDRLFSSGNFDASGAHGGSITLSSNGGSVMLYGVHVSADGTSGGGTVHVGGGAAGQDVTVCNASDTAINFSSIISADALINGNGGHITFWGNSSLGFAGTATAKGGSVSGNGGLIEISAGDVQPYISTAAIISANAPHGAAGTLLYDPKNITIATGGMTSGLSAFELVDPNAADVANHTFGSLVTALSTGNIVVAVSNDDFAASGAGAVYLFNGSTGALISTLRGGQANDAVGTAVSVLTGNGNYVIRSSSWDSGTVTNVGAVTWGSGTAGISGTVSSTNSLVGSTASDGVGNGVTALTNGNYVVRSTTWDNGTINSAGAVTWGSGTGGTVGAVSSTNSLVGSKASDRVGGAGITALTNGNYVVNSYDWDNGTISDAGAVTWGNGATGISGVISSTNSLVGTVDYDYVGAHDDGQGTIFSGVRALSNGNYVVISSLWNNGTIVAAGAVTWGNGVSGIAGVISSTNSLVGSVSAEQIGAGGITPLTGNGNYVIMSPYWYNGTKSSAGAVTWSSGTAGITGTITSTNSLVGSTAYDVVGSTFSVTALSNGNYVTASSYWNNGTIALAGAVTWGSGTGGTVGIISSTNSLVGSTAGDIIGTAMTVLTNGNYVVRSSSWDNGTISDAGAVTWSSGTSGIVGIITSTNSLVGSTASDFLGNFPVASLSNGNYVVSSTIWNNGTISDAGAATWGSGTSGVTGVISSTNSLIGSTASDGVGTVTALANGNYVVSSSSWDNGTISNVGAATWGNGTSGITGVISSTNSLVGSTASDGVGTVSTLANGNYVVNSANWDNGTISNAGAATWGSGTAGIVGVISSSNSIVGTSASTGLGTSIEDTVNGTFIARFTTAGRLYVASSTGSTLAGYDGFSDVSPTSITLDPTFITTTLNAGTSMTLQANNDITVTNAITANNPSGNGGALTLQAGRSILLDANITTDNGNLFLYANEKASAGVVNAYRDSGTAVIAMGTGTSINAGSGTVTIRLDDGAGNTNSTAGPITLYDITAGALSVQTTGAGSDINISGAYTATGTGGATLSAYRHIILEAAITLLGGDLLLRANNADNGNGAIFVGADISTGGGDITIGGGSGTITAGTGYAVGNSAAPAIGTTNSYGVAIAAVVDAGGGDITINGQAQQAATADNNHGVVINSGTVTTSGIGAITIHGIGGGSTDSGYNHGIYMENAVVLTVNGLLSFIGAAGGAGTGSSNWGFWNTASTIVQVTGTGALIITGTGGLNSGTGAHDNSGIYLENAISTNGGNITITGIAGDADEASDGVYISSDITSNGGNIIITGTGGGNNAGDGSSGVDIYAAIDSAGGDITIAGVGATSGTGQLNYGVYITESISAGGGDIVLTGTGGVTNGAGDNNGIYVYNSAMVNTTGTGTLTVTGTGGGSGLDGNNHGIYIDNAGGFLAENGTLSVTGVGGGDAGGETSHGIYVTGTGSIIQTTGTGILTLVGTGGIGEDGGNRGIRVADGGIVATVNSALNINGTGGGIGIATGNYGVEVTGTGSAIQTTGTGTLTITGTGGGGEGFNYGILLDNGGSVTGVNGNLIITGTGGGGGGAGNDDYGVAISNNFTVQTTGTGNLAINGTGGAGTGGFAYGVYVDSDIILSTLDGDLSITGIGGGAGSDDYGINVGSNVTIQTTGTGNLTISGTGGVGTGGNSVGIYVDGGATTTFSTVNGDITISGTGVGGGTSGSDDGIYIYNVTIQTTGTGGLVVNGIGGVGTGGDSLGIYVDSDATLSTVDGDLSITGIGGGAGTGTGNYGVYVVGTGAAVKTTGSGTLTVTGSGGNAAGSGGNNHGVYTHVANAITTTGSGNITVAGVKGGQASSYGIYDDTANSIKTAGTAGNITLLTDTLFLNAANEVVSVGSLTIAPNTTGSMAVGTTGSTLNLSDAYLGYVNAASYIFGSTAVDNLTVSTGHDFVDKNVTFLSGGNINLASTLTKATGSGTVNYNFDAYGNITNSGSASVTASAGKINLVFDADYDNNGTGGLTFNGATFASNGGDITFNDAVALSGSLTATAGTGALSFASTVNGAQNLTVSAKNIGFGTGTNIGGSTPLLAVALTSTDSIVLPSISAQSIFVQTTGTGGNITIGSGKTLTASGTGNAITLASSNDFTNSATTPFSLTGGGRWLVYSHEAASNSVGALTSDFYRYSCSYSTPGACSSGTVTIPGTGNGFLYSISPTLTLSATPSAIALTYGDVAPTLVNYSYSLSNYLGSDASNDTVTGALTGTTDYTQGSNIGTYYIHYASGTLTSALGYTFSYADNNSAITVGQRSLTIGLTGTVSKEYDGNSAATIGSSNYSFTNLYGSDALTVSNTSATYNTKDADTGKIISLSGLGITGTKAANYTLTSTTATGAVGVITKKILTATADSQTITAGTTVPSTTIDYSGFISGENAGMITTAPSISSAQSGVGVAGTYNGNYTLSGGLATNYSFSYVAGSLIVNAGTAPPETTPPLPATVEKKTQDNRIMSSSTGDFWTMQQGISNPTLNNSTSYIPPLSYLLTIDPNLANYLGIPPESIEI